MIARVRVTEGADVGREFAIEAGETLVIGRGRDSARGVIDTRSDPYALCATLYALFCGRRPSAGRSLTGTIWMFRETAPTHPKKYHLGVPELLEGIVLTLLAKRTDDRYQNPAELVRDL